MSWSTVIGSDRPFEPALVERIRTDLPGHLAGVVTLTPIANELRLTGPWHSADKGPMATNLILEHLVENGYPVRILRSDLQESRVTPPPMRRRKA